MSSHPPAPSSAVAELRQMLRVPPPHLPSLHHGNTIAVAHAALEHLRDTGDTTFLMLRSILELMANNDDAALSFSHQELLFHCILGVRQVVLWQWNRSSHHFKRTIREYFMMMGHHLAHNKMIRNACYTTVASWWKRGWSDDTTDNDSQHDDGGGGEVAASDALRPQEEHLMRAMNVVNLPQLPTKNELFAYLRHLFESPLQNSRNDMLLPAAALAHTLVTEFGAKSAVNYRLPLEFHKNTHRDFERGGALTQILQLAWQQGLSQILAQQDNGAGGGGGDGSCASTAAQQAVLNLVVDVLHWEFGGAAWDTGHLASASVGRTLLRPPNEWRAIILQDEHMIAALVRLHVQHVKDGNLTHAIRQLLLTLASLTGSVFGHNEERQHYATMLLDGTAALLQQTADTWRVETSTLPDLLTLLARVIQNFRLTILVQLPILHTVLQHVVQTTLHMLSEQMIECEQSHGALISTLQADWREDAITLALDCVVLLATDPWLLYSNSEDQRREARQALSNVMGPLYESFVHTRTKMAAWEEHHSLSHAEDDTDLDNAHEELAAVYMEDQMADLASIGRLNLSLSLANFSNKFESVMPRVLSLWSSIGQVTPDTAALLEESRLLTMFLCHLLTDDNDGETPAIPETILVACQYTPTLSNEIAAVMQFPFQIAEAQGSKLTENPSNERLSPLLAKTFLWFLHRWAPAYVCPRDLGASASTSSIARQWSSNAAAPEMVRFCLSLCLHYQCHWPQEQAVQEAAVRVIHALALSGKKIRPLMIHAPAFQELVKFHCLTSSTRHSMLRDEFHETIRRLVPHDSHISMDRLYGYQRLPYRDRAAILTSLLIASSDSADAHAATMFNDALRAVHDSFSSLVHGLSLKQVTADDVTAKELACLCIELFCGVVLASEMEDLDRIPHFITQHLQHLSGLMAFFAFDLTVCEALLRFFRNYTEHFIAVLDVKQSMSLFNAAAIVLKSYSSHHCAQRTVKRSKAEADAEEEQAYSDILCALQLLINLGTKDFIDACSTKEGVDSNQVTDIIFLGLQQILPLMTQGLLQLPHLCSLFFDLVGFMMDTYPEKVSALPYDLFNALLEALLFGMGNSNIQVAQSALQGLSSIATEQAQDQALQQHLNRNPGLLDNCIRRLLTEVVFQTIVVDRMEAAAMALLSLIAAHVQAFANLTKELVNQVQDERQRPRLHNAFERLVRPEVVAGALESGYEGRMHRKNFKELFTEFVGEVHLFLVLK